MPPKKIQNEEATPHKRGPDRPPKQLNKRGSSAAGNANFYSKQKEIKMEIEERRERETRVKFEEGVKSLAEVMLWPEIEVEIVEEQMEAEASAKRRRGRPKKEEKIATDETTSPAAHPTYPAHKAYTPVLAGQGLDGDENTIPRPQMSTESLR